MRDCTTSCCPQQQPPTPSHRCSLCLGPSQQYQSHSTNVHHPLTGTAAEQQSTHQHRATKQHSKSSLGMASGTSPRQTTTQGHEHSSNNSSADEPHQAWQLIRRTTPRQRMYYHTLPRQQPTADADKPIHLQTSKKTRHAWQGNASVGSDSNTKSQQR